MAKNRSSHEPEVVEAEEDYEEESPKIEKKPKKKPAKKSKKSKKSTSSEDQEDSHEEDTQRSKQIKAANEIAVCAKTICKKYGIKGKSLDIKIKPQDLKNDCKTTITIAIKEPFKK